MSAVAEHRSGAVASLRPVRVGPIGQLGGWTADHVRAVAIAWAVAALALAAYAPKVESPL
jgi:RND superfamily putative drug exporter